METKADKTDFSYYRKPVKRAEFLYVIKMSDMSDAEKTMIGTLQGIIANKSASQIYILDEYFKDYSIWLEDLKINYRVEHKYVTSPWALLEIFKRHLYGYILYKDDDSSINAACSLAGLNSAIAVNEVIEGEVRCHGIKNLMLDVRGKNDSWVKANYWDELNHSFIIEQKTENTPYLRDYAAMTNSFVFFDGISDFRDSVMADMNDDTACIGWGDSSHGEEKFVGPSSKRGVLGRQEKVWCFQWVKFPPGQGVQPLHPESSLGHVKVTTRVKRRQSDIRAVTQVKQLSLDSIDRGLTGSNTWKATVGFR